MHRALRRSRETLVAVVIGSTLILDPAAAHAAASSQTSVRDSVLRTSASEDPAVSRIIATSPTDSELASANNKALVRKLVRCVDLDGENFCLHAGFIDEDIKSDAFWNRLSTPTAAGSDASLPALLRVFAAQPKAERLAAEVAMVREARQAVGKVKLGKLAGQGKLPDKALLDRYSELKPIVAKAAAHARVTRRAYTAADPTTVYFTVIGDAAARRQTRSYYCGPATLQMIDGADDGGYDSQESWDSDLGTTTSGTAISAMVREVNAKTSWDSRGGPYAVVSVADWTTTTYWNRITNQIGYYRAPVIEHPRLHNDYHTYLSTTGGYSGHFQPGRGYQVDSAGTRYILVLEPFNEPDWTNYTTRTWGPQRVRVDRALAGNKANSNFKNIGI
jgi:hypothetical protein